MTGDDAALAFGQAPHCAQGSECTKEWVEHMHIAVLPHTAPSLRAKQDKHLSARALRSVSSDILA